MHTYAYARMGEEVNIMTTKKTPKAIVKKAQTTPLLPISMADVQNKIIVLRGEPVLLDRDVAALYGVETREINQALKNNPSKFPAGYAYVLDNQEAARMRSKILTSFQEVADNERVSSFHIKSHYNPTAFTEKGLYMLATKTYR